MKKILLSIFLTIGLTFSLTAQNAVDSTDYEANVEARFKRGLPRQALINMFLETHKIAYLTGYRGDFADSTTLATNLNPPFIFNGYRPFATVGTSIYIWSGSAWTPVAGAGGGATTVNHNGDFVGSGTAANPLGLANNSVGSPEIASGAVNTDELADNAVDSTKIALGAVKSGDIGDGEVGLIDIDDDAVNSAKIVNGSVTHSDLADVQDSVFIGSNNGTAGPREELTVAEAKALLQILFSDIINYTETSAADGHVIQHNGTGYVNGLLDGSNITDESLTGADIGNSSITLSDLANNSVNSSKIVDLSVSLSDLNTASVNSDKIVNGSIAEVDISNTELINIFDNPPVIETALSVTIDDTDVPDRYDLGRIWLNPAAKQTLTINNGVEGDMIEFVNLSSDSIVFVKGTLYSLSDPGYLTSQYQIGYLIYLSDTTATLKFEGSGGGSGATNLTVDQQSGSYTVQSSTGTDVDLPLVTTSLRGIMSPTDKTKLDFIEPQATADQTGSEINTALNAHFGNNDWSTTFVGGVINAGAGAALSEGVDGNKNIKLHSLIGVGPIDATLDGINDEIDLSFDILSETEEVSPGAGYMILAEIEGSPGTFRSIDVLNLPSSGQTNLMQNIGVGGVGPFDNKSGVTFNMRNINGAPSSPIAVTLDAVNDEIDLDITANTINAAHISTGGVGTLEILDGNVTTDDIAGGAVDNNKLAANAVRTSHIQNGEVKTDDIDSDVVTNAKLSNMVQATIKGRTAASGTGDPEDLTATQVRTIINVEDGANNYTHPNHTGEVTSTGDGATVIASGVVDSDNIVNGTILAEDIGTDVIVAGNLATNSVGTLEIVDGQVSQGDLANDAVNMAKIDPTGGTEGQVVKIVSGNPAWADDTGGSGGGTAGVYKVITNGATQYDIVLDDSLQYIWNTNASVTTDTLPTNANAAFPKGYSLVIYAENNDVKIILETGVDLDADTTVAGEYVVAQGTHAVMTKVGGDEWNGSGFKGADGYGPWQTVSLLTGWTNLIGTAKWREVYQGGVAFIQYNSATIRWDGAQDDVHAFQDFSGIYDFDASTWSGYHSIVESSAVQDWVFVIYAVPGDDDMVIATQNAANEWGDGAGNGVHQFTLPSTLIPISIP